MLGKVILRKQLQVQLRLRFTKQTWRNLANIMEYVHSDLLWCWMVQSLLLYFMRMSNQTTFQHVANTKIGGILKCGRASLRVLPEYTLYISIPNAHGENVKEYVHMHLTHPKWVQIIQKCYQVTANPLIRSQRRGLRWSKVPAVHQFGSKCWCENENQTYSKCWMQLRRFDSYSNPSQALVQLHTTSDLFCFILVDKCSYMHLLKVSVYVFWGSPSREDLWGGWATLSNSRKNKMQTWISI